MSPKPLLIPAPDRGCSTRPSRQTPGGIILRAFPDSCPTEAATKGHFILFLKYFLGVSSRFPQA